MNPQIIDAVRVGLIVAFQGIATLRSIAKAADASDEEIATLIHIAAEEAQAELDGLRADLARGE